MNFLSITTHVRIAGILGLIFIVYLLGWVLIDLVKMGKLNFRHLPAGYENPVLALELAQTGAEIEKIKQDSSTSKCGTVTASEFLFDQIKRDWALIVIYVLFFSVLALVLWRSTSSGFKLTSGIAVGCAFAAGILDVFENRGMIAALKTTANDSLANSIRYPSLAKWALFYLTCLLIGFFFLWAKDLVATPTFGFGLFFLLAGLVGIVGVVMNLLEPQFNKFFPASFLLFAPGLLWVAISFTFMTKKVVAALAQ